MNPAATGAAFLVSAACAAVMGFAIQRGATCTVAAVDEVLRQRRCGRLLSMVEASLWVAGGLAIVHATGVLPVMSAGYPVGALTVVGGALLGVGAYVNGACVFGAIARLGSGEWSYVATPVGFYLGCVSLSFFHAASPPQLLGRNSPVLQAPLASVVFVLLFLLARLALAVWTSTRPSRLLTAGRRLENVVKRAWSPHLATTVIALSFLVMLLLVGAWAYTDVLADLAHGMAANLGVRILLLVALLAGAMLGGALAGRWKASGITLAQLARCIAGGVLMGWGSLLIPGGNDGLVLVGMPLLWPYAWTAFLTMALAIAAAHWVARAPAPAQRNVGPGRTR